MFFLLRCLFWLGLVFSHIATLEGTNAAAIAAQGAQAASASANGFGRIATDAASRQCRAEPKQCLALAAQAVRLSQNAGDLEQALATPSRDTLNSGDRVPAWRLRAD